jgi:hypothetical protein
MKTIFTLLASFLFGVTVFAADVRPKSMLTVTSVNQGDIKVVVDGRRFEPGDNSLLIRQLESGIHQVKIYRQKSNGVFNILGKRYEMVYNTSLMVKPKTHMTVIIDRNGRAAISESKIRKAGNGNKDRNRDRDNDWDNDDYDFDRDGRMGDYDQHYGYQGMNNRDFTMVLQSIEKEWLETNKLKSATQIVRTNSLTSSQVKQLVRLFGFESNKLELAKQAYQNTIDKQNYHTVADEFSFSTSKNDLNKYIRNVR